MHQFNQSKCPILGNYCGKSMFVVSECVPKFDEEPVTLEIAHYSEFLIFNIAEILISLP
jgi:hypothetical protein